MAPRVRGYCGDSCNTFVLGEPTERFQYLYETARKAIEHAGEILRPGITAGDFDSEVRGVVERAGLRDSLHTGHGVGTSSHEWPRLVPNSPGRIPLDVATPTRFWRLQCGTDDGGG
ncbi:MAG: M24 family metallopeptidase [Solirubrobacteraceae bacterium]